MREYERETTGRNWIQKLNFIVRIEKTEAAVWLTGRLGGRRTVGNVVNIFNFKLIRKLRIFKIVPESMVIFDLKKFFENFF